MIGQLVFKHDKKHQLWFSIIGSIIGLVIMLLAVQLYLDLNRVLASPALMGKDFLVVNKEVSMFGDGNFTADEILEIEKLPYILGVAPVESNRFESFVEAEVAPGSKFNTLVPLISIPDEYIDLAETGNGDWIWKEGDSIIPVIVPTTYFNIYNFGIAEASKSPKVTRELMAALRPRVRVGHKEWLGIRIYAFSDRFSDGVIVPKSFLDQANVKYGKGDKAKLNRIVISTLNAKNPELSKFIENNGYQTNLEKLKGGKVMEVMNVLLPITLVVALVIVLLALLTFIQNAELMLVSSSYELNLLGLLGYSYSTVSRVVMKKFNKLFALILIISFPVVLLIKWIIDLQFQKELEINLGFGLGWFTLVIGVLVYGLFYLIQHRMIRKHIRNAIAVS
ncbi:MAG: hypothetical protein ACI9J3_003974 [Parvicellaceae bacterium]|jgi:hypothetical protein